MSKHRTVVKTLFLKIAEPRHIRIIQFGVYVCLIFAGTFVLASPPSTFESVVGRSLVYLFGGFLALGSSLGAVAVLPGVWWLERVGLISMGTGILMYILMAGSLGVSPVGLAVSIAFILTFVQRWYEIKGSQLAPREE